MSADDGAMWRTPFGTPATTPFTQSCIRVAGAALW
jgi:hypothetical protein